MPKLNLAAAVLLLAMVASASAAELQYPLAIARADSGTIYLADRNLPGVWKIDGGKLSLFFEGSKKFRTPLNAPRCIAIDKKGRVLAGDSSTREVYRFDEAGKPQPLTGGEIGIPMSIAVNSAGDLLVADLEVHYIWKVPDAGGKPVKFAEVPAPRGLAIDAEDRLWVVSHGKDHLVRISPDGKIEPIVKGRPFQFAHTVVLDKDQTAYVCDGYAKTVWKVGGDGKPVEWAKGKPLINPVGLAWKGETLLIVDPHAKVVFQADPEGKLTPLPLEPAGK